MRTIVVTTPEYQLQEYEEGVYIGETILLVSKFSALCPQVHVPQGHTINEMLNSMYIKGQYPESAPHLFVTRISETEWVAFS